MKRLLENYFKKDRSRIKQVFFILAAASTFLFIPKNAYCLGKKVNDNFESANKV